MNQELSVLLNIQQKVEQYDELNKRIESHFSDILRRLDNVENEQKKMQKKLNELKKLRMESEQFFIDSMIQVRQLTANLPCQVGLKELKERSKQNGS